MQPAPSFKVTICNLKQTARRAPKYRPLAFTEHGALQAANILNSKNAAAMSVFVIRAFIKMRQLQSISDAILKRLAEIDSTLLTHDAALRNIYEKLLPFLDAPEESEPPRRQIGFHVKDAKNHAAAARRV